MSCAPASPPASPSPAFSSARAAAWPEADALFHQDPDWLGADAAYSVDLGAARSLWIFGDTFVATSAARVRAQSKMVHNSVAIQTGRDPTTATMRFGWAKNAPGGSRLVLFLTRVVPTTTGLHFALAGWRAVAIDTPDADPSTWQPRGSAPRSRTARARSSTRARPTPSSRGPISS